MDTASLHDPVEPLYDARIRGSVFISTYDQSRVHLHGGCWVAPVGGTHMMVAFPKEFEGADLVKRSGRFALSFVARDERAFQDRFFLGEQAITPANVEAFLRAPSGCPVLRQAVAYLDMVDATCLDLGDFLLAVGRVDGGFVLRPEAENLTVNEIIATADPRGVQDDKLPFQGFAFDVASLPAAPTLQDLSPEAIHGIYRHREWGLFWVAFNGGTAQLSAEVIQTSHVPPSMAMAWPGQEKPDIGDTFMLTLATPDPFVPVAAGETTSPPAAKGGIAYFSCRVSQTRWVGDAWLVIAPVVASDWMNAEAINLRLQDVSR